MYSLITASPGPKVLPYEVALPLAVDPSQVDSALALDVPNHLRNRILWRDRNHHMDVIRHQMAFLDPARLLHRQSAEHFPKMMPQLAVKRLPAALGNEHHMIFALPFAVTWTLVIVHRETPSRARGGSRVASFDDGRLPEMSNFYRSTD